jgi:hypothetical protein
MKALGNLLAEMLTVVILLVISAVFMNYYEAKQVGKEVNVVKEVSKQLHNVAKDAKDGWNEAEGDTLK